MYWKSKDLHWPVSFLVFSALSLLTSAPASWAGIAYLWPVSGSTDIRGTYGDFRQPGDFHTGVDIFGHGGDDGLLLHPLVPEMVVIAVGDAGYDERYVTLRNAEDDGDIVRYHHVTGLLPDGEPSVRIGDTYFWNDAFTRIGDFCHDGDQSNDHLHLMLLEPRQRNPLWDSPDWPHLPYSDSMPPMIEGILFTAYSGPYSGNALYSLADMSNRKLVHVPDYSNLDIIVYAHDDGNKVGVRGLSYAVLDGSSDEPSESEWIPFCDFTEGLPDAGDVFSVYAFERDSEGADVLTTPGYPSDRMWYIVTNTSGSVNSFNDNGSWLTPSVPGDRLGILKTVWIRAVDAKGNVAVDSVTVKVVPDENIVESATMRVVCLEHGVSATWTRGKGPWAVEYRLWMKCGGGSARLVAEIATTEEGESGRAAYVVEIPTGDAGPECTYELEAVMEGGSCMPLAWAKAIQ